MPRNIRILVLEDKPADYELIAKSMQRGGLSFEALRVETEQEFTRELTKNAPDIVLSDHGLPQFTGDAALDLTKRLAPGTPVIFVTGDSDETSASNCSNRADGYVCKEHLDDLLPTIGKVLQQKETASFGGEGFEAASLQLFKCAVEQAKEAVLITTAELDLPGPQIIYVNDAFTKMTGYTAEDVRGKTPRILQGPRTQRKVLDVLKNNLKQGKTFSGETFNYRKDGSEFLLQWEIAPMRNAQGLITHFVSVQRDVTERRREAALNAELSQREAERQARMAGERRISEMLNQISDAFVSLDAEWRYTFVNEKAGKIFGRKPEELIGKYIWKEFPEGVGQPFQRAYERALAEQKYTTIEEFYEPWQRWLENRIHPSPQGLAIFFRDVTEQRRQRNQLQATLERFELVTRVTRDVIYDWNIKDQQIRWNQNYYSVFQYDFAEPEEDVQAWANHLHPDDRERVEKSLAQAIGEKANFWQETYRFGRGDGSYADVSDRGFIVRDEAGLAIRMVGSMVDITEQTRHNRFLYETTQHVTSILESITDAFVSLDRAWIFTYVNKHGEQLLGRSREELIGRHVWQTFPELADTPLQRQCMQASRDRTTAKFEAYYQPRQAWLLVAAYPSPEGLSIYFHDITDRKKAEQALRASEEFSSSIVQSSSDCIEILDLEGRLIGMSEGGQRMMEIDDLQPFLGRRWIDFWKNGVRKDAEQALAEACAGRIGRFQGSCPTRAGTPKFWDVICTPILGPDRRPERLLSISRDITELKAQAEAQKSLEARKEAIFSSALDAIITIDHESLIEDWNPAAEKIFGYRKEDVLGESMVELIIPPTLREAHRRGLEHSLHARNGELIQRRYEMPAMRADGSTFPAEISISRIVTEGEPLFTGFVRDISQRKEAERQLREQEERLRLIIEGAKDYAIFTLDPDGRVTSWNSGAEKILKYSRDNIIGVSESILFTPEDVRAGADQAELQMAVAKGLATNERWHVRKTGERFWGSGFTRPFKDAQGNVAGFLKIMRDDTHRRQAHEEIERLNAELEERVQRRTAELETANRELEAFSYSVSHDLRAPLRHIKAFGEMLEETAASKLDPEEGLNLERMIVSAEKMSALIDDLLSFSRMLRSEFARTLVSMNEVLDDALQSFALEMQGRTIDLHIEDLPTVIGDYAMLRQVMTNLLSNALKYTRPRDTAQIVIGSRSNENEHVLFVRDNGVGFDPHLSGKLFGVFQRLHSDEEFEGTGIGLANVRRIIERHGGKVWAEASPGKGATFYFTIPNG